MNRLADGLTQKNQKAGVKCPATQRALVDQVKSLSSATAGFNKFVWPFSPINSGNHEDRKSFPRVINRSRR